MKSLNWRELSAFVDYLNEQLQFSQLQEIQVYDRGLALGFWRNGMHWLMLDLNHVQPMSVLIADSHPWRGSRLKKPIGLFLASHAKNKVFEKAIWVSQYGRVFRILLSDSSQEQRQKNEFAQCEIEVRLIPRQSNLGVRAGNHLFESDEIAKEFEESKQGSRFNRNLEKSIWWEKPQELQAQEHLPTDLPEDRPLEKIYQEWMAENSVKALQNTKLLSPDKTQPQNASVESSELLKKWQKALEKKQKALSELQKQSEIIAQNPWRTVGDFLKQHSQLDVPSEWEVYVDKKLSLHANIQRCYEMAKSTEAKRDGNEKRILDLQNEIEQMQLRGPQALIKRKSPADFKKNDDRQFKARKKDLGNDRVAYLGKSAADNLNLLRQARAWDFWLHLRDFPGAHVIIRCQKDAKISDAEMMSVAQWLAEETMGKKQKLDGQKFDVLVAQVRYVKPIKGDKLGRVTYQNERVLRLQIAPNLS